MKIPLHLVCLIGANRETTEKVKATLAEWPQWKKDRVLTKPDPSLAEVWCETVAKEAFFIYNVKNGHNMKWEVLTDRGRETWIEKARIIMAALDILE
jgi:hypothetical protein